MQISEEIKTQILEIVFKHLDKDCLIVFVFGSYAQNKAKSYSDIDIGIFYNYNLSLTEVLRIKSELNENIKTLREIDFVNFEEKLDEKFKKIALKEVIIWHQGKESKAFLTNI
jgi:predicted nucleotidyltransferase